MIDFMEHYEQDDKGVVGWLTDKARRKKPRSPKRLAGLNGNDVPLSLHNRRRAILDKIDSRGSLPGGV